MITYRNGLGRPLTAAEVDANFAFLENELATLRQAYIANSIPRAFVATGLVADLDPEKVALSQADNTRVGLVGGQPQALLEWSNPTASTQPLLLAPQAFFKAKRSLRFNNAELLDLSVARLREVAVVFYPDLVVAGTAISVLTDSQPFPFAINANFSLNRFMYLTDPITRALRPHPNVQAANRRAMVAFVTLHGAAFNGTTVVMPEASTTYPLRVGRPNLTTGYSASNFLHVARILAWDRPLSDLERLDQANWLLDQYVPL